jgi:Tubulin binding cofactor C
LNDVNDRKCGVFLPVLIVIVVVFVVIINKMTISMIIIYAITFIIIVVSNINHIVCVKLYLIARNRIIPYHTLSYRIHSPTIHGSVRLEKMTKCRIFLGPCCTSVYIEECSEVEVFLACHQLRIHKSHNCQLYVRVNSHPIIEDCTGFGFAPYNIVYDCINDDFKVCTYVLVFVLSLVRRRVEKANAQSCLDMKFNMCSNLKYHCISLLLSASCYNHHRTDDYFYLPYIK